jgi:catechol 2,3-dioxygenase-like lactoylglutathione lyase family enzyme
MNGISARFVGVELYFDDLERAKKFYTETFGLLSDDQPGHHVKFDSGAGLFAWIEKARSHIHRSTMPFFSLKSPTCKQPSARPVRAG